MAYYSRMVNSQGFDAVMRHNLIRLACRWAYQDLTRFQNHVALYYNIRCIIFSYIRTYLFLNNSKYHGKVLLS